MNKIPENQILVIFGASGDLTRRKLLPSLFELFLRKLLPKRFLIVGVARTKQNTEEYRTKLREAIIDSRKSSVVDGPAMDGFLKHIYYISMDTTTPGQYPWLARQIDQMRVASDIDDNILYYLATPPTMYALIPRFIQDAGMNRSSRGWRRIIVEKPYGRDEESARELDLVLRSVFPEKEIYRIDHFLGKETVQNILVLRFSNGIWEPLWNHHYIDRVEITAAETLGMEGRGGYYETAGALRDMVQNHLMQLMAFIAMEPPSGFDTEAIRDEIVKVFRSLRPLTPGSGAVEAVRAQYKSGTLNGKRVGAYREEPGVASDSSVETYVALKFFIDNWRWSGVPFYFYTGKRLCSKRSEIVIYFKSTPQHFFEGECEGTSCNRLTITLQPDESIRLSFGLKQPGEGFVVRQVSMDFFYNSLLRVRLPDAYERLLLDAMIGDSLLYARSDSLEASWHFLAPLLHYWEKHPQEDLVFYEPGSGGPAEVSSISDTPFFFSDSICSVEKIKEKDEN
ncbi:glucose-6-phosphate dehydrogenase [Barnesiella propionica]|uniref:glucose-6-phosphate dehydrogenase n=1 Tax=Barnesiella propionica TaxID=2981781 RepID=UPI0011CCA1E7|nr:glucose-6-phosphate dehydrogenase [Barnesiella propionica]MCU6769118.1 glucose-6-phosphate dehydrogenase [Barnesiella propionica]